MLAGYPHLRLAAAAGATPTSFYRCRLAEPLAARLARAGARAVWVQGWQVLAYWQAVWAARRAGCEVWLRAESNDLSPTAAWKRPVKAAALGAFFRHVDAFLAIGSANRRLYRHFGVAEQKIFPAPYAVDNDRFAAQAASLRPRRAELRRRWGIREDAFCVLFCGKFVAKKRPLDLIEAARAAARRLPRLHLLFVGSGELGDALRARCDTVFDAETGAMAARDPGGSRPVASFAGFLNQTEISQAYVAADCLVLPSDHGETWGLVVNEATASGLPAIVSDRCGSAEDLGTMPPNQVFRFADIAGLADCLAKVMAAGGGGAAPSAFLRDFSFDRTVETVAAIFPKAGGG
jgi:glycosyltransferase involved in cell wall biosynthesis